MLGNIEFVKVWRDEDFFEVSVKCTGEKAVATTSVYMADDGITSLHKTIDTFVNDLKAKSYWQIPQPDDKETPILSFEFIRKDLLGHIEIEVYMLLEDGGSCKKHSCCFRLETELGLLKSFGENLIKLNNYDVGTSVILQPECS